MSIPEIYDASANATYAHPNSEQVRRLVLAASNATFILSELETVVPNLHKEWLLSARNDLRDIMAELENKSSSNKSSYLLTADDELRKAAEEAADLLDSLNCSDKFDRCEGNFVLKTLRAALNKGKS